MAIQPIKKITCTADRKWQSQILIYFE